jgi:hypothetical protein
MTEKNKAKIFSFSMPDAPKKQEKVTKITLPDVFASPMTKKPSTKELKLEVKLYNESIQPFTYRCPSNSWRSS